MGPSVFPTAEGFAGVMTPAGQAAWNTGQSAPPAMAFPSTLEENWRGAGNWGAGQGQGQAQGVYHGNDPHAARVTCQQCGQDTGIYFEDSDSDTDDDDGSEIYQNEDVPPDESLGEYLFGRYKHFKKRFRRFKGREPKRYRRMTRRHFATVEEFYNMKGGKKGGKGGKRRGNPIGPDGEQMKCSSCGSTDHFRRNCPQGGGKGGFGKGKGTPSTLPDVSFTQGPLSGLVGHTTRVEESWFVGTSHSIHHEVAPCPRNYGTHRISSGS